MENNFGRAEMLAHLIRPRVLIFGAILALINMAVASGDREKAWPSCPN